MPYTDPTTLEFVSLENPLASAKLQSATNEQFLALFPQGAAGLDWSPDLQATGTSPASESVVGGQYKIGAFQFVWARFTFSGGGGVGVYFVDLPEPAVGIESATTSGTPIGVWSMSDVSAGANGENGVVTLISASRIRFRRNTGQGNNRWLADTVPTTIAENDVISFSAQYPWA